MANTTNKGVGANQSPYEYKSEYLKQYRQQQNNASSGNSNGYQYKSGYLQQYRQQQAQQAQQAAEEAKRLELEQKQAEQNAIALKNTTRQITDIAAQGVGADRSNTQKLLQKQYDLEKATKTGRFDEDLSVLDRIQLTAQGIGESYNATPDVLFNTAKQAVRGDKTVDMDSDAMKAMQRANQASQQATYGMGDTGAFLWNVGASVAENAAMMPLAVMPGGKAAVLGMMGAKAAAQKAAEVGDKGGTARDALVRGVASGSIEAVTEKLGLDNAIDIVLKNTGEGIIRDIVSQALAEGGEETLSYLGNLAIDKLAKDPDAKFSMKDLGASALGGALAGGVMGTGVSLVGRNVRKTENENLVSQAENEQEIAENETAKAENEVYEEKPLGLPQQATRPTMYGSKYGLTDQLADTIEAEKVNYLIDKYNRGELTNSEIKSLMPGQATRKAFEEATRITLPSTPSETRRFLRAKPTTPYQPVAKQTYSPTQARQTVVNTADIEAKNAVEQRYGEQGKVALNALTNATEGKITEFERYYRAGQMNTQRPADGIVLTKNEATAAYMAGVADAKVNRENYAQRKVVVNKEAGLDNASARHLTMRERMSWGRFAKALGVKIKFVDTLGNLNAKYDMATGELIIARDADNFDRVPVHEIVHRLRQTAPEEFYQLSDSVLAMLESKGILQNVIDRYGRNYGLDKGNIDYYDNMEEIVADFLSSEISIDEMIDMVSANPSLMEKLLKIIEDVINSFKGVNEAEFKQAKANLQDLYDKMQKAVEVSEKRIAEESARIIDDGNTVVLGTRNSQRFSQKSLADACGFDAVQNEDGTISLYDMNGRKLDKVTDEDMKNSPIALAMEYAVQAKSHKRGFDAKQAREENAKQLTFIKDMVNLMLDTGDFEMTWEFIGSTVFNSIKKNSDAQYNISVDFSSICRKTQTLVTTMSKLMTDYHRGLTKQEIIKLYNAIYKNGFSVPCPQCYVFARWVGAGNKLEQIFKYQNKYANWSNEALQVESNTIDDEIRGYAEMKGKKFGEARAKLIADKRKELIDAYRMDSGKTQAEIDKIADELLRLECSTWIREVRLATDYKPVPTEILFDLNRANEFSSQYPAAWKFRNSGGAGEGKSITPYADARFGEFIKAVASKTYADSERKAGVGDTTANWFDTKNLVKTKRGVSLSKKAKEDLRKAINNAKVQNLRGGYRWQSYSDYRYEYATDYLITAIEMNIIGAKCQTYTKVPEALDLFGAMGLSVNCSYIPLGKGYDANGNLIDSAINGIDPEVAETYIKRYDTVGNITIGNNDTHIEKMLDDSNRHFVIPYHKSGGDEEVIGAMNATTKPKGTEDIIEDASQDMEDYSPYQSEKILPKSVIGEQAFAQAEKYRAVRKKILSGATLDSGDIALINTSQVFKDLYYMFRNENSEHYGVKFKVGDIINDETPIILPFEYWDTNTTYETSYKNSQRYLEYCKLMGLNPKFNGKKVVDGKLVQGKNKQDGNMADFTTHKFYWKLLIDRRMYGNDGQYVEQKVVTAKDVTIDDINPAVQRKLIGADNIARAANATDSIIDKIAKEAGIERNLEMNKYQEVAAQKDEEARKKAEEKARKAEEKAKKSTARNSLKMDLEYLELARNPEQNKAQLEQMVEQAARDAGYDSPKLYHGTNAFGFTEIDPAKSDDGISFFATDDEGMAKTYTTQGETRNIADKKPIATHEDYVRATENIKTKIADICEMYNKEMGGQNWVDADSIMEQIDEKLDIHTTYDDLWWGFREVLEMLYNDFEESYKGDAEIVRAKYENHKEIIDDNLKTIDSYHNGIGGIYSLYANTDNFFEYDAKGSNWNRIPVTEELDPSGLVSFVDTRLLSRYAKNEGYKGAIIHNVYDYGGAERGVKKKPSTVYIFFEPQSQIKSADPVTYDNNGDVIPLSERFNPNNPDIRFSKKTEPDIPQGYKERGYNESTRLKTDLPDDVKQEFIDNPEIYKQLANKKTLARANAILEKGADYAETEFRRLLEQMDATAIPLGYNLAKQLIDNGQRDRAVELLRDMSRQLTKAGQFSQAAAITLMRADPMTALRYVQRDIDKLNADGKKTFGSKWKDFELTAEEEAMFKNIKQGDEQGIKDAYKVINERIAKEYPSTIWQKFVEASRISMLLNPKTNVKNIVSNAFLRPLTRASGVASAAMQRAYQYYNKDYKPTQAVTVRKETKKLANDIWDSVKDTFDTVNKYNEGIKANKHDIVVFKDGPGTRMLESIAPGTLEKINKLLGEDDTVGVAETLRRATYFFLEWGDDVFVKRNFIDRLGSYLEARGISEITEANQETVDAAIQVAYKEAMMATFKDDTVLSQWMAGIKHTKSPVINTIMEMIMPFTKTPANIAMRGIDYSPIGLLNALNKYRKGKDLDALFDELGKSGLGTALILVGMRLFASGLVTGGEPEDKDKAAFLKQQGWLPYAVKSGDTYVTYDWAQPAAIPIIMGVTIAESLEEGRLGVVDAVKNAGVASFNQWMELSPLQSLQEVMGGYNTTGENLLNTAIETPQRLIPSALGATARTADTTQRVTYSKGDVMKTQADLAKSKIPGASKTLPAAYDTWGNEKKRDANTAIAAINQYLNPTQTKTRNESSVDAEIERLFNETGDSYVFPRKASYSIAKGGQTYTLSNREYSEYQRIMGQLSYDGVNALMANELYDSLTDKEKAEIIKDIYDNAFETAKFAVMEGQGYEKTNEDIRTSQETKIKQVYMDYTPENIAEYYLTSYIINNADSDKNSKGVTIAGSKKKNSINRLMELGYTRSQALKIYDKIKG